MSSEVVAAAEPVLRCERAPILVRDIFEAKGYRELDEEEGEEGSPSSKRDARSRRPCGTSVEGRRFKPSEYAAANPLQRLNHFPKDDGHHQEGLSIAQPPDHGRRRVPSTTFSQSRTFYRPNT